MRAESLAGFCLATGVQPSEALALTRLEREAFWTEYDRIAEKMRGR